MKNTKTGENLSYKLGRTYEENMKIPPHSPLWGNFTTRQYFLGSLQIGRGKKFPRTLPYGEYSRLTERLGSLYKGCLPCDLRKQSLPQVTGMTTRLLPRVYRIPLTFDGKIWKLWRNAPGFNQRFEGVFGENGSAITAYWETSIDGKKWERDFDLTYTKAF